MVEHLIKKGANVNIHTEERSYIYTFKIPYQGPELRKRELYESGDGGCTPLLYAAHCDNPKVSQLLVDAGADKTAQMKSTGETPIQIVCRYSYRIPELVSLLHVDGLPDEPSELQKKIDDEQFRAERESVAGNFYSFYRHKPTRVEVQSDLDINVQQEINKFVSEGHNPYQVLGITRTATEQAVKKSYREKVLGAHPDRQTSNNSSRFILVKQAYDFLSDNESRVFIDRLLYNSNAQGSTFRVSYAS